MLTIVKWAAAVVAVAFLVEVQPVGAGLIERVTRGVLDSLPTRGALVGRCEDVEGA
ncbi:hypothetical protein IAE22_28335 [Bacillus sp. S34]|nr:hypothetical protein [Bacillus sp. S34]